MSMSWFLTDKSSGSMYRLHGVGKAVNMDAKDAQNCKSEEMPYKLIDWLNVFSICPDCMKAGKVVKFDTKDTQNLRSERCSQQLFNRLKGLWLSFWDIFERLAFWLMKLQGLWLDCMEARNSVNLVYVQTMQLHYRGKRSIQLYLRVIFSFVYPIV